MPKEIDEDLIEATIRRVAEQAARVTDPSAAETEPDRLDEPQAEMTRNDAVEAVIRRVAESKAARSAQAAAETPQDDAVEAVVRRVAESKAARAAEPPIEMPVADAVAPVFGAGAEETAGLDLEPESEAGLEAEAPFESEPRLEPEPDLEPLPMPRRQRHMAGTLAHDLAPVALHDDDLATQLRQIAQRLDAIVPLLERIAQGGVAAPRGEWERASATAPAPQRPIVVSDNGTFGDGDVIDTRPLPEPLPPLVEPKRGFDLLPRTYRITVEDKRRGVDLVPLHRAMLGVEGVRDMSLLSYSNGTAIVALETQDELEPERVRLAMQHAMKRDARIEVHNENTMVVKLTAED